MSNVFADDVQYNHIISIALQINMRSPAFENHFAASLFKAKKTNLSSFVCTDRGHKSRSSVDAVERC